MLFPFHPCRRSTTCPYDEEDIKDIAQRAARDEDGEVYYVPDNMTYQEWKKAFVDDSINWLAIRKNISYSKAGKEIDYRVYRYIGSQEDRNFLKDSISAYADTQEVTEICAEAFSVRKENVVAQTILQLIGGDDWQ